MDFFKKIAKKSKKRKSEVAKDEGSEPKRTKILSWVKDKINHFMKKDRAPSLLSQAYGETPTHQKVARYMLTPEEQEKIANIRSTSDFYIKDTNVTTTENRFYEFKAAGGRYFKNILPQHVRKYGSGFLNSRGGTLLAGILDNGIIKGVFLCNNDKQQIIKDIDREFAKFRPKVEKSMYSVVFTRVYQNVRHNYNLHVPIANLYVVEINVKKGLDGEIYEDGFHKVFVRREASVEGPLSPLKIKGLVLEDYKRWIELADQENRKRPASSILEESCTKAVPTKRVKTHIQPIHFDLK